MSIHPLNPRSYQISKFCLTMILAVSAGSSFASSPAEIEQTLRDFHSSNEKSKMIMNQKPKKYNSKGQVITPKSKFSKTEIQNKSFIERKNQVRDSIFKVNADGTEVSVKDSSLQGRAAIADNDLVEELVDNGARAIQNLEEMDRDLKEAKLKETPWSDTYWPLYMGATAQRYADDRFPFSEDWGVNFKFFERSRSSRNTDKLSPAEKYDLLVGDKSKTYTKSQWDEGRGYYESNDKKVETWMGLCHGWAPAAYMLDRPQKSVTVTAADGRTELTFRPSDIKALATSLWASARMPSRFIGGRCNTKNPTQSPEGRVMDQDCFDNNPGAFHMTTVNQIGVAKRSFVVDVTFDEEVWNQPVYEYKYSYFNPKTLKATDNLKDASVNLKEFTNDKFKNFRNNPKAVTVVGVNMEFSYIVENEPSTDDTDSPDNDSVTKVSYMYDLELDANGNIVGGEWYTNVHPDFMWTPAPKARAVTPGDRFATGSWDALSSPLPGTYMSAARASSRQKLPLAKVVEALIEASKAE